MNCYNTAKRVEELQRCGCPQCRREYYELTRMSRDYFTERLYVEPPSTKNAVLSTAVDYSIKEKKVEKPKNIAHEILIDRFKAEQAKLKSAEVSIASTKSTLAIYNKNKVEAQKNLKELGAALKKLGHKEETNNA